MTFQHDCDACRPLGTFENDETWGDGTVRHRTYDLYACQDSVLARYGGEGHEYLSSLMQIVVRAGHKGNDLRPLQEAFWRVAEERGDTFKAATTASIAAYVIEEALGPNVGDAPYIAARDAHAKALVLHRNAESGPYRRFHVQMADAHADRVRSLRLCLP